LTSPRARFTVTDELVTVRGRTLRVQVRRPQAPSGPPLLVINGIGAKLDLLDPFVAELPADREVIRFDPPGIGGSPAAALGYHVTTFAPVVGDLVTQLGHDRVDVLGYSWGGAVAQQLARDAPRRVRRLVLVATSPGRGGKTPLLPVLALMGTPLQLVSDTYLARIAPVVFGGDVARTGRASRDAAPSPWGQLPTRLGYAQQMYAISGWTSLPWLARITAPTLVISGTDDPLIPVENARLLANRIPGARLTVVDGGGHLWLLEHANAAAVLVDEFLSHQSLSRRPA
jgi:poly(3-hydroxyalkanoate) depolymerase